MAEHLLLAQYNLTCNRCCKKKVDEVFHASLLFILALVVYLNMSSALCADVNIYMSLHYLQPPRNKSEEDGKRERGKAQKASKLLLLHILANCGVELLVVTTKQAIYFSHLWICSSEIAIVRRVCGGLPDYSG